MDPVEITDEMIEAGRGAVRNFVRSGDPNTINLYRLILEATGPMIAEKALLDYAEATKIHKDQEDRWLNWENVRDDVVSWATE